MTLDPTIAEANSIGLDKYIELTAEVLDVPEADIVGTRKLRPVKEARWVAIHVLYRHGKFPIEDISSEFNIGRSGAYHALSRTKEAKQFDAGLYGKMILVEGALGV